MYSINNVIYIKVVAITYNTHPNYICIYIYIYIYINIYIYIYLLFIYVAIIVIFSIHITDQMY